MELFEVTRFDETKSEKNHESKLLKKLLKKAKKRKLQFEDENTEAAEENNDKISVEPSTFNSNDILEENAVQETDNVKDSNFQVLGDDIFKKKQKVDMVLPPWLAYPTIISTKILKETEDESLQNLEYLSPKIKENLQKMGITRLFPVQKEVVSFILSSYLKPFPFRPKDVCVSAPTGSGKTLAFGIPLIQLLMNRVECNIHALVILPTNELALQIFKVLKSLAEGTVLSIRLLSKSVPFFKEQQLLVDLYEGKYHSKADIIVTTPGRLVEHLHSTKGFCLRNLKYLVIDEADRIMEQVHFNWLYHLDKHVRATSDNFFSGSLPPLCLQELTTNLANLPHKMLFSATLSHDPEKLISLKLFQPKLFTTSGVPVEKLAEKLQNTNIENKNDLNKEVRGEFIGKYTTPSELTEKICLTEVPVKPLTLFALIKENDWNKFLCFTNSVDSAYRLSKVLDFFFGKNENICELSASLSAPARNRVLNQFSKGRIKGLICSDALARGIDIPNVDIVISYDVPRHIKTYIHRIGRTARAGRPGTAITLLSEEEMNKFKKVLADAGKIVGEEIKINSKLEETYANHYTKALRHLEYDIIEKKKKEILQKRIHKYAQVRSAQKNDFRTATYTMEKLQEQINQNLESRSEKQIKGENQNPIQRKYRKKAKTKKLKIKKKT